METFSALLALCAGNSLFTGEFPAQRPVTRSFGVFFDLRLNNRLSKQSWGLWFETPSCSLWCHVMIAPCFSQILCLLNYIQNVIFGAPFLVLSINKKNLMHRNNDNVSYMIILGWWPDMTPHGSPKGIARLLFLNLFPVLSFYTTNIQLRTPIRKYTGNAIIWEFAVYFYLCTLEEDNTTETHFVDVFLILIIRRI